MFFLAKKQMMARKKQTTLIFLGVAFGTMIYVVIAGVQLGMRQYLADQLLNNTAHIRISGSDRIINEDSLRKRFFDDSIFVKWITPPSGKRDESRLENPQGWFSKFDKDPNVKSYAPKLTISAMANRGKIKNNVQLVGIIPQRQVIVTGLEDYMKEGSLLNLNGGGNQVVLCSGVANNLGARVGETITFSIGQGRPRPFKIVGILHLGNQQIDNSMAFAHIRDVQSLNKTPGRIGEISVALVDMEKSMETAHRWALYAQDKVESWQEANAAFMQIIVIQDIVRMVITFSILIVAAFGIYNVLTIMIGQKQKEIAILRSIGYPPKKILELFLIQGLILGILGGVIGLFMGHGLNLLIESYDLGISIGKGSHLIISFDKSIYVTAFSAAIGSAIIASLIPAYNASKLTPLEIIRANL